MTCEQVFTFCRKKKNSNFKSNSNGTMGHVLTCRSCNNVIKFQPPQSAFYTHLPTANLCATPISTYMPQLCPGTTRLSQDQRSPICPGRTVNNNLFSTWPMLWMGSKKIFFAGNILTKNRGTRCPNSPIITAKNRKASAVCKLSRKYC